MAENDVVNIDRLSLRPQTAAVAAVPGTIEIQNINNALKKVTDQGATSDLGGGDVTANIAGLVALMAGTSTRIAVTGADVQTVDFTGLSGDTDGDYEIEFYVVGKGSSTLVLQPELLTTNQSSRGFFSGNAGPITFLSGGTALSSVAISNALNFAGRMTLRSKSGQGERLFTSTVYETDLYMTQMNGMWTDTTTVMTQLRIKALAGAHIGVGSWFVVRKLGKL